MREHKFRARDIATGKWYIGSTNPAKGEINLPTFFSNIHVGAFDVNTLGEATGLKDKNGKEIWELDRLNVWLDGLGWEEFEVRWNDKKARYELVDKLDDTWGFDCSNQMEVIGNAYED